MNIRVAEIFLIVLLVLGLLVLFRKSKWINGLANWLSSGHTKSPEDIKKAKEKIEQDKKSLQEEYEKKLAEMEKEKKDLDSI